MNDLRTMAEQGQAAAAVMALAGAGEKDRALCAIADALRTQQDEILAANARDVDAARNAGLRESLIDRLTLTPKRIEDMAAGAEQVAALSDPIGGSDQTIRRPNGLLIGRRRVPLGLIGLIYEARPNVTVDAAVLCLKAGNAVLLRGGKEAVRSNTALANLMRKALSGCGLPEDAVCFVEDTTRESATAMMNLTGLLNVLIPRGGAGLIRSVVENARVPVIETGVGICHIYVDEAADLDMAVEILYNAKTSRPSVCNAAECVLVARPVAEIFLAKAKALLDQKQVEWRGCSETCAILGAGVKQAVPQDYDTEYGDYILSACVVSGLDEAVQHIARHGSGHSEAIVTGDYSTAQRFLDRVDAAAVYVNASTRFTDGGEFGLGAEIGISTQKMHARGPMGIEALTSVKYVIYGDGQVR